MSLRRVLAITRRLLEQFRRDRRTLALLFLAPILVLSLLGYLLRGGSGRPAIGVVSEDAGPLGRQVAARLLDSSLVKATEMDEAAAERKLEKGDIAGFILLPEPAGGARVPEVHLEGSQPGQSQAVLQALAQVLAGAAAGGGGPRPEPRVTYLHGGPGLDTLDYFGAAFIGLVVFFLVFVITSVAFLRERVQGTLERLMASALRRGEIVLGYMLAFSLVALAQSLLVLLFSLYVLRVHNTGSAALIFLIEALVAVAAVNLGIFVSMFARTEFEAVQFIPLVIVPQVLLSGVLVPVSSEAPALQAVSNVLPLTYAVYGLRDVMLKGSGLTSSALLLDIGVVVAFGVLMVVAAAATLRRRVA